MSRSQKNFPFSRDPKGSAAAHALLFESRLTEGLTCLAVLLAATTTAMAQAPPEDEPTKLTLSPAPAASPALKYVLLPELSDQTPGNAALEYYRAFSPEWWANLRQPKTWERIINILQPPLKDLPRKELDWLQANHWLEKNAMLRQVDLAARREYVDWGIAERLRREGYNLALPDVQSMRSIGTLLELRARLEIIERRYDKAVYTFQTGLATARHVGDGVILIQDLVGIALAQLMLTEVEGFIQQPDAPNLYWALTDLPRPFFDLRKALQGEKMWLYATLPEIRSLETTRLTPEQQQKFIQLYRAIEGSRPSGPEPSWSERLMVTFLVLRSYPESKKALIAEGRKPEEVEALPTLQVALIHSLHQSQRLQDDLFKWYGLPYWEAKPRFEQADKRIRQARNRLEGLPFIDALPALQKVVGASARTDRRIAILRCLEAIRLYSAAHDGKLPKTLDTITEVPIPIDPMSGKAFAYRVSGDRATLSTSPPPGDPANSYTTMRYELTLRRPK